MSLSTSVDAVSANDLETFGYHQQLSRRVGTYASFAAGFSFVSILTTVFQLFGLGFSFGGTAFFWTWPAVLAGQLMVALCFAELSAHYPISGAIYQWSRRLGGAVVGWAAGWTMAIAQVITVAAAAIALQVVLPAVWSGFQVVGSDPSLASRDGAANAVLLGCLLLVLTTTVNALSVRTTAVVNSVGVTCELVGVVLLVVLLFGHAERGPSVVLHTTNLDHTTGYVVPPPPKGFATWEDFDRSLPTERQGTAFACVDPSGVGPRLFFQRVPEGKVVKNRVHLDVRVGTGLVGEERVTALEAECARLVALGAVRQRLLLADGVNESCLVMQDIEGNEFCLD